MDPADRYVERFVEDVDLAKVLTAGHIMKRPERVTIDRGPRVALRIMKDAGVSTVYVVDRDKTFLGCITADGAAHALQENKSLKDVLTTDIPTVAPDTLIDDLFEPMKDAPAPLAVVNGQNHLIGLVVRGAVIGALAGDETVLNGFGNEDDND